MRIQTFEEFWPFYLREHSNRVCRGLHYVGSTLALGWLVSTVVFANPWLLLAALVNGYAFAWVGHFFFEKNRPATFKYPLWSFAGDWKMYFLFVTGRMGAQLSKLEIRSEPAA